MIQNTTSGYKLFSFINAISTFDIVKIFKSTTLGMNSNKFLQLQMVINLMKLLVRIYFYSQTKVMLLNRNALLYGYGGILGFTMGILNFLILFFLAFPKIVKFPVLILIFVLLGIAINPLGSASCILFTTLFIESYSNKVLSDNL